MSKISFLKSILSTKNNCKYFIESIEASYRKHRNAFPGYDPHFYLAQAWTAYMTAGKGFKIDDPEIKLAAFPTTFLSSCIPHPKCAWALGVLLLYRDRPEELGKNKQFLDEFNELMSPVMEAEARGTTGDLYQKYNPNMARLLDKEPSIIPPGISPEHEIIERGQEPIYQNEVSINRKLPAKTISRNPLVVVLLIVFWLAIILIAILSIRF